MFGYFVLVAMLFLSLTFLPGPQPMRYEAQDLDTVTKNFAVYQSAAVAFYADNPGTVGVIPQGSLGLMPGYNAILTWQNQVSGNVLYVYFPNGQRLVVGVLEKMKNSRRVGLNTGGRLVSPLYGDLGVVLPGFIPEGSLVAVSQ